MPDLNPELKERLVRKYLKGREDEIRRQERERIAGLLEEMLGPFTIPPGVTVALEPDLERSCCQATRESERDLRQELFKDWHTNVVAILRASEDDQPKKDEIIIALANLLGEARTKKAITANQEWQKSVDWELKRAQILLTSYLLVEP